MFPEQEIYKTKTEAIDALIAIENKRHAEHIDNLLKQLK